MALAPEGTPPRGDWQAASQELQENAGLRALRIVDQGDEWQADWTFAGAVRDLEVVYTLGEQLANSRDWPNWSPEEAFRATRDASAAERR